MRELIWIKQWGPEDIATWVDVTKFDEAWKRDAAYYVPLKRASTAYRCKQFGKWIKLGQPIWMPHVAFKGGIISFTDGRHRFAWLRDHCLEALPVTSSPEDAGSIASLLGTKSRRSMLG
jgi:hypothetical protein